MASSIDFLLADSTTIELGGILLSQADRLLLQRELAKIELSVPVDSSIHFSLKQKAELICAQIQIVATELNISASVANMHLTELMSDLSANVALQCKSWKSSRFQNSPKLVG